LIGSQNRTFYCLKPETGEILWKFKALGKIDASPVISGNTVVVATADGRLHLLDLNTGNEHWIYEIGSQITATPAVANGMIATGAFDGNLYLFGNSDQQ
jgi:outer membrane protein assembly factor BamB